MLSKLVWLFAEHRKLAEQRVLAEADFKVLTDSYIKAMDDNKKLAAALEQMQQYIANNPSHLQSMMDMFQKYQEKVLQDVPLEPDQSPEWLTPGDPEPMRDTKDG